ncbi:ribosome maturation protein SBDS [Thermogladius calderae 1633]|uniref:Ribosome maturation protein SBDS n=1 Tax=Thermogladius calderae (strain DSM 22663 / VKM B-2946 / 1633) TaxID=1184251 RepID=I3TDJ7_THEC1|nr:ribosome maturation protein SBDS [Thermogladius calderae 1633]
MIVRLEEKGHRFEVLVNPDLALKVKEGKPVNVDDLLVGDFIYKDARKGLKASPESLREVFKTDDVRQIALEIVRRGEIQLTAEQRRKFVEEKKKQIITLISKNAVDPKTKLPIPQKRIELAIEQAKVSIDPFKPPEAQMEEILSKIARVIPIKIAKAYLSVRIPPEYAGKIHKPITQLGEVKKSTWMNDGSLLMEIEIPAGMQQEFIDKVNSLTKGTAQVKIISVG